MDQYSPGTINPQNNFPFLLLRPPISIINKSKTECGIAPLYAQFVEYFFPNATNEMAMKK